MIIGIDPGITGGISIIRSEGDDCSTFQMPTNDDGVDAKKLLQILHDHRSADAVYLEKAQAMPKQGVVSMFNYGKSFGIVIGVVESIGLPIIFVSPQKWQKVIYQGCPPELEGKVRSIWAWDNLFSGMSYPTVGRQKCNMGMLEATLIAEYGRRQGA